MIKSKFMTMVISPMLQGMNILITHGTLEIGEVPKSALQAECHGKDTDEKHAATLRKILLVQAKNPFEKIKDAYVRQSLLYKNVYIYYTIFV